MKSQYIIKENDIKKREEFFDYIMNTYDLKLLHPYIKERFVNNKFPFVVDFYDNSFWVCESITCCAAAAQAKIMISTDEFKLIRRK